MDRNHKDTGSEEDKAFCEIIDLFCGVNDSKEMRALMDDLFTPAECSLMVKRWLLTEDIYLGKPQRQIAAERNLSLCKITRGSKILKKKNGFLRRYFDEKYKNL